MATNSQGMVDARFFGAHDKAWVPIKDCFLFSRKDPNSSNAQKSNINECIKVIKNSQHALLLTDHLILNSGVGSTCSKIKRSIWRI